MPLSPSEPEPAQAGSLPADVKAGFLDELGRIAGPLAEVAGVSLAYASAGQVQWIASARGCPCSGSPGVPIACLAGPKERGRAVQAFGLTVDGKPAGSLVACWNPATEPVVTALCHSARTILRRIELEREEKSLQARLSASGESLEAVHDITSNLRSVHGAQELLDRIVARAVAFEPAAHAVLWVAAEGKLRPAATKNTGPCTPRDVQGGLLGKVLAGAHSLAVNGLPDVAAVVDLEPELRGAASIAAVPVRTREGQVGVLVVWQEGIRGDCGPRLMQLLETLAFLAAMVLENDRLQRTSLESDRLRHDIDIASRIQQTLLLGRPTVDLKKVRAAALTIPSWQIDGDFYDFFAHDQTLDVVIGDVMGKGISAALLGAATKNHFLRATNYLLSSNPSRLPEPREVLTIVNAELVKQLIGLESFVTLCYARFDLNAQKLELIDCGHTRTIHSRGRAGTYALLQGDNTPLGFSQAEDYAQLSVPIAPGDVFFFYSDGVTETRNRAGEQFGERRLAELVHAHNGLGPKELIDRARREITAFSRSRTFVDDLTCVAVKIQDMEATAASIRGSLVITSDLAELPRARAFLRDLCRRHFDLAAIEEDLGQLELALTEVLSNIIIHAFQRQPGRQVRLEADLFINRLSLRVYHRGQPFDPTTVDAAPLEGPREGQMGMHIIRACVYQVEYYRSRHGENCVHLMKVFKQVPRGGH